MAVDNFWIFFEKDVDNSGEAIVVESFFAVLAQMNFTFLKVVIFKFFNLDFKFLSEELAVGLGPNGIFFDDLP